jgi:hypothetical protein
MDMVRKVRGYVEDCYMQTATVFASISSEAQEL